MQHSSILRPKQWALSAFLIFSFQRVAAHVHDHSKIVAGDTMSPEPLDSILWTHIMLMMVSFGIIFPTGMVLGVVRNRWHVPTQVFGTAIAVVAYFLGHLHQGRVFDENVHARFSNWLMLMLIVQIVLGIYLRFHITKGFHGKIRKAAMAWHGILGKTMPVLAWVQMLFGGITALGFCRDDHLGQCLAHFIMGSAFIGYATIMTILMLVGQFWLQRIGRSPEFFDSMMIAAWGCVNTFTEHRWGGAWVGNDIQHTTMGIVWWCAGLVGIWLSRKRTGAPKRNFIPGFVIFLTGWAMSAHPQHLPLSTMIHTVFGYTLMAAGITRIIEVAFILGDRNSISEDGDANSFQYIPPFLLYASGFLFMGATEEQMQLVSDLGITHVSYVLVLYSFAFLIFLFVNMLLHLYVLNSVPAVPPKDHERAVPASGDTTDKEVRHVRDAEEYELEGLMSEDEDEAPESPSTLGKNFEERV